MKNLKILILLLGLLIFRCSDSPEISPSPSTKHELIPKDKIDEYIINSLHATNDFNWNTASDEILWSALMHSDSMLTIGYKPLSENEISSRIATVDVKSKQWSDARSEIVNEISATLEKVDKLKLKSTGLSAYAHEVLPYMEIKIQTIETISRLRAMPHVRYAEPMNYEVNYNRIANKSSTNRTESDSGCSNDPDLGLPIGDYSIVTPNGKIPWNYYSMNIPQAWNYSTGQGITVGLIDTGISAGQSKLNGEFNSGESNGRFIQKYGTYVSSWWPWASPDGPNDQCGHGTAMAGTIAAPRSNSGTSVGVAYNCNLVAFRGTGDVIINGGSEKTGVANALVALGNRTDVKIISMSIGDVFSNSKVADAIRYAYGKGKLIFAAAGTSTDFTNWFGVIFPATMNETVAVTGIKEGAHNRCNICHSGSKVDFTIVMEKSGTDRHPITLAMNGNDPSTVGGSSVATATAAGIAALIWAKNPNWSRSEVLERMKQSSTFYPNRHSEYGWGTPDVLAAIQ